MAFLAHLVVVGEVLFQGNHFVSLLGTSIFSFLLWCYFMKPECVPIYSKLLKPLKTMDLAGRFTWEGKESVKRGVFVSSRHWRPGKCIKQGNSRHRRLPGRFRVSTAFPPEASLAPVLTSYNPEVRERE